MKFCHWLELLRFFPTQFCDYVGQLLGTHWLLALSPHTQEEKSMGTMGNPGEHLLTAPPSTMLHPMASSKGCSPQLPFLWSTSTTVPRGLQAQREPQAWSTSSLTPLLCGCSLHFPSLSFSLTHCRASILLHLKLAFAEASSWAQPSPVLGPSSFTTWPHCPPILYVFVLLTNAGTNIRGPKTFSQAVFQGTILGRGDTPHYNLTLI